MYELFAGLGATVGIWFEAHPFVAALLLVMLTDVTSGTLLAAKQGKLVSSIARDGLFRKMGMLIALLLVEALTLNLMRSREAFPYSAETLAAFMILPEFFSVIENLGALGVPLPPGLTGVFAHLNGNAPKKQDAKLASGVEKETA